MIDFIYHFRKNAPFKSVHLSYKDDGNAKGTLAWRAWPSLQGSENRYYFG